MTATAALAAPHRYVLGDDGILVVCSSDALGFDVGGVCIAPGEIVGNPSGGVTFTIDDDVIEHVSAFVCEDANADSLCGGPGETAVVFCDSATIFASGTGEVLFVLDGPIGGGPIFTTCGTPYSGGVSGLITVG